MTEFEFHPLADLFPLMTDAELASLAEDIKQNGQREPIWVADDKIIDGRNRYLACKQLGKEPLLRYWSFQGDESLTAFVLSLNLHRRHLTTSQRAAVAADAEPFFAAELKEKERVRKGGEATVANLPQSKARDKAAEKLQVSPRSVQDAKQVKERSPDLHKKVKAGEVSLHQAKQQINNEKGLNSIETLGGKPEPTAAPANDSFIEKRKAEAQPIRDIVNELRDIKKRLLALSEQPIGSRIQAQSVESTLNSLMHVLRQAQPHVVCPRCGGDGCNSPTCRKTGWMTSTELERDPEARDLAAINSKAEVASK